MGGREGEGKESRCSQTDHKAEFFNIVKHCSAPEITQGTRKRKLFLDPLWEVKLAI